MWITRKFFLRNFAQRSAIEMRALLCQVRRTYETARRDAATVGRGVQNKASDPVYRALRDLALIDLLFATGMRVGEVSSLDAKDFSAHDAVFRVRGKGGRDRLAFAVDQNSLEIQRLHLRTRMEIETASPSLFLNIRGERLSTQGISGVLTQGRKEAGIKRHITPHMLRHTVATLLLRNGADIRIVQEFLGHASIATTQRYTHITKEHMIGVLRKHHPSFTLSAVAK